MRGGRSQLICPAMLALRLLGVGPHAGRPSIREGRWDDAVLLVDHQCTVNGTPGEEDEIMGGPDIPTHGGLSAGVAPQWCGHTGKKDNELPGWRLWRRGQSQGSHLPGSPRVIVPCGRIARSLTRSPFRARMNWQPGWERRPWSAGGTAPRVCRMRQGCGHLCEIPHDIRVWPLLEADGQTVRASSSSWVRPQVASRNGPVPHLRRLHPGSPTSGLSVSRGPRLRLLEGHKGQQVAGSYPVLRAILPLDRLPGPERDLAHDQWIGREAGMRNAPLEMCVRVSGIR